MKTVGNDLVRHQLHQNRKWYLMLGVLLTCFGALLLCYLPFSTLSAVYLFGILMMTGGFVHVFAGFKIFSGGLSWVWALFGVLYFIAGYYAFSSPNQTAIVLTEFLGIILVIAGVLRTLGALIYKSMQQGWGWVLFSGILTFLAGLIILTSPTAPFWVLGLFLATDILFQGINYLFLASYIKHEVPKSSADE